MAKANAKKVNGLSGRNGRQVSGKNGDPARRARIKAGKEPRGPQVDPALKAEALKARNASRGGFERTASERERDLAEIARLHLMRYYRWEIVALLNEESRVSERGYKITMNMIDTDIEEMYARWRSSTLLDFNEAKWREIETINHVEREANQAWLRSIGERTTEFTESVVTGLDGEEKKKTKRVDVNGTKVKIKVEQESGNAAYLRVILACSDRRVQLMGLATGVGAGRPMAGDDLPAGDYDIGVELSVNERARRLISIFTVAQRRLEAGEKPPIETTAEPIDEEPVMRRR